MTNNSTFFHLVVSSHSLFWKNNQKTRHTVPHQPFTKNLVAAWHTAKRRTSFTFRKIAELSSYPMLANPFATTGFAAIFFNSWVL
jgi:hypothetical protein